MIWMLYILIMMAIFWIAWEDFTHRSVHIVALILLFIVNVSYSVYIVSFGVMLKHMIFNLSWLLIQGTLLMGYAWLRYRHNVKSWLKQQIGIGDVLFMLGVTPLFYPHVFFLYYLSALLISALVYLVFLRKHSSTIPLAGLSSVWIIPFLIFQVSLFPMLIQS